MENEIKVLSDLVRETVGASCQIVILKNNQFKIEFTQSGKKSDHEKCDDPKKVILGAISYILSTRRLLTKDELIESLPSGSKYTMKK